MLRNHTARAWLTGLLCVVLLAGVGVFAGFRSAATPAAPVVAGESPFLPMTTAVGSSGAPPWAVPSDPTARAALAGLRMLSTEGTVEHIHAHLSITVDGETMLVPGEIGIDNPSGTVSPLHTHDTAGIIHVESPVEADFTLGQFFTEWNVALSSAGVGSYTSSPTETFTVFVDKEPYAGDPAAIVFTNKMEIDLLVSPAGTTPVPAPAFDWPPQY